MSEVRTLWRGAALLGEGPMWDACAGVLWFVDIKRNRVHRFDPADCKVSCWDAPAQVGWVLPADDGALLAGLQTGIARFDPATGCFDHVVTPDPHPAHNRLNDATIAPDGVIWFGSMDDDHVLPTGRVFCFDGRDVTDSGIDPVAITNGPAVSPDGRLLYYVDTLGGIIHVAPIEGTQVVGPSQIFVTIDPADGNPDGLIIDSAGNVWVGLWGGSCARLYAPDATLLREVRLPAANVTKVALGGPRLTTAYVTTASIGLNQAEMAQQPDAGGLFAFEVDVPGQALPLARGHPGGPSSYR